MKNNQIELIIFDAYGPILSSGYPNTINELVKRGIKAPKERLYEVIYKKYFNLAAERKITQKKAWQLSVKELNLPMTWQQLRDLHYSLMKINQPVLQIARKARKHYKILLLSKNTRSQFVFCRQKFPVIWRNFDAAINTWELGLPKASKKTIHEISRRFKVKPTEILFIDDQKSNLVELKKMGGKIIFYQNYKQFKKEFDKFITL
jgi:FMN phosphatase YigB (HAD superfamily)